MASERGAVHKRESFLGNVTCQQRFFRGWSHEPCGCLGGWGRDRIPSRGTSQCKGSEAPDVGQGTARRLAKARVAGGGEAGGDRQKVQGLESHSGALRCSLAALGGTNEGPRVGAIERGEVSWIWRSSIELVADVGGLLLPSRRVWSNAAHCLPSIP